MPTIIINQEAFLTLWAERLGVSRNDLGDDRIRMGLALYHGAYLPTSALVELRMNELDLQAIYSAFGYTPNVPSLATATLTVTIAQPAPAGGYLLPAPFTITQLGKRFRAVSDLFVRGGQTTATAEIKAEVQGELGTPEDGTAQITQSVGWLRGAIIRIGGITPGLDGDDSSIIAQQFRTFAAHPDALVRADDHANWVRLFIDEVPRAIARERTESIYTQELGWTLGPGTAGHLTVAVVGPNGAQADADLLARTKHGLLQRSIPYGAEALHVVPVDMREIGGTITVKAGPTVDHDVLVQNILDELGVMLSWQTWPEDQHVYAGEVWSRLAQVPGVMHVQNVNLTGRLLDGSMSDSVYELFPWELPVNRFTPMSITVV